MNTYAEIIKVEFRLIQYCFQLIQKCPNLALQNLYGFIPCPSSMLPLYSYGIHTHTIQAKFTNLFLDFDHFFFL